jgi:hypothetical protein
MLAFDRFVEYVQKLPDAPRLKDVGRGLAETVARALGDLKTCVGAAASAPGQMLVFRLLPPPS